MLTPNNSLSSSHANSITYKQHCFESTSFHNHPIHDLYAWGTILCNVKRIDNISNVGRRGDVTILKPENFSVLTAHKKHPFRTLQSRPQVQLQALQFPSSSPRPHPEKGGKTTFIGLISRGIGKLAGQCSGLDTFPKEASVGGGE